MRDTDLQPFSDSGQCKHTHTRKALGSELHQCQNCGVALSPPRPLTSRVTFTLDERSLESVEKMIKQGLDGGIVR